MINEEIKSGEQFSLARTLIFNAATKVGIKIPSPTFFIQKFHNQYFFFQTGIYFYSLSADKSTSALLAFQAAKTTFNSWSNSQLFVSITARMISIFIFSSSVDSI